MLFNLYKAWKSWTVGPILDALFKRFKLYINRSRDLYFMPLTLYHPMYCTGYGIEINPFRPEFTMVIFIHYKPRIAVAILDL